MLNNEHHNSSEGDREHEDNRNDCLPSLLSLAEQPCGDGKKCKRCKQLVCRTEDRPNLCIAGNEQHDRNCDGEHCCNVHVAYRLCERVLLLSTLSKFLNKVPSNTGSCIKRSKGECRISECHEHFATLERNAECVHESSDTVCKDCSRCTEF